MEMATKGDEWERKAAEHTLERVCKAAVPELINALNDPDIASRPKRGHFIIGICSLHGNG